MRNPWICVAIVLQLGLLALACVGGLTALGASGRETSIVFMSASAFVSVTSTCVGALASFLVNVPRGSVGGPPYQPAPPQSGPPDPLTHLVQSYQTAPPVPQK